jgi:hypothetical protein
MSAKLRVLMLKDDDLFIAQALEIDICAQGETETEAAMRLQAAIVAEEDEAKKRGRTLAAIGPAPRKYHDLYESCVVSRTELFAA